MSSKLRGIILVYNDSVLLCGRRKPEMLLPSSHLINPEVPYVISHYQNWALMIKVPIIGPRFLYRTIGIKKVSDPLLRTSDNR